MKYSAENKDCDLLYGLYWKLICEDILFHLGKIYNTTFEPTEHNKKILHEFHKRVLGHRTISGSNRKILSLFIQEVTIFWAIEKGIFVRTSRKQPLWIEMMELSEVWNLL